MAFKGRLAAVVVVAATLLSMPSLGRLHFIDTCLDRGGVFVYSEDFCSMAPQPAVLPAGSWVRLPGRVAVLFTIGVVAVMVGGFRAGDLWRARSQRGARNGAA